MSETKNYRHVFDKGCHQPWYVDFIMANYLVVHNDGGDRMRILRWDSILITYKGGDSVHFASLDEALETPMGRSTEILPYLEDALAIRKEEFES